MARFINKMDVVACLPANPKDPNDNNRKVSTVLSTAFSPLQKAMQAHDYRHVCTAVILDPTTSKSLHMMIAGMEVAALGREGQSGSVAEHVARPHFIPCYAEHLAAAVAAQAAAFEAQSENAWATLPSVGTWLNPLPWEASEVAANGGGKSESTAFDTREFLNYGSSLLSDFRGRGPRVLVDLHDQLGSYTKKQLEAMGVESNKIAKVPLETVLRSGPELLHTEAGQALLRQGQEQLLTMLPMLTLAAQKDGQSQASKQILMQMERNGVASKLLAWSRAKVRDAETDPELLRSCLASFNISNLADISSQIYTANAARLRKAKEQCIQLLYSEAAREKLRAAGIHVDDDEDVDLEQVLSQGQDLLKTEEGREVLRTAQAQALSLLAMLNAKANGTGLDAQAAELLRQLQKSRKGAALISWGQRTLDTAHQDPETLQGLLTSLDLSKAGDWTGRCRELLTSGAAGLGLVWVDGNLKLDTLIEKGQKYMHTDSGTKFLREAQKKALLFIPRLESESGLLQHASKHIQKLESSDSTKSRQLLEQGRTLLASAEEDPDALKKWLATIEASQAQEWQQWGSQVVANEAGQRDAFLKTVTDTCLEFLSEQLKVIKVPKIESDYDASDYEYSIDNIDLSSCAVDKDGFRIELKPPGAQSNDSIENVPAREGSGDAQSGTLHPAEGESARSLMSTGEILRVTARDMKVHIPEMKWKYAQKKFPYFNGHGAAATTAHGAQVILAFELRSAKVNGELVPRLALAFSRVVIDKLDLRFQDSSFSWLYNTLGYLFQDAVRDYVVQSLAAAVNANIASLLEPLNRYLHPYWPLVLSTVAIPLAELPQCGTEEYVVELGLETEEPIGCDFVDAEDGLVLLALEEGGPLERWNETATEQRKVCINDLLIEVDGLRKQDIPDALDRRPLHELVFRRMPKQELPLLDDMQLESLDDFLGSQMPAVM